MFVSTAAFGQPPNRPCDDPPCKGGGGGTGGGGGCHPPPCIPINQGVLGLLAVGALYGVRQLKSDQE